MVAKFPEISSCNVPPCCKVINSSSLHWNIGTKHQPWFGKRPVNRGSNNRKVTITANVSNWVLKSMPSKKSALDPPTFPLLGPVQEIVNTYLLKASFCWPVKWNIQNQPYNQRGFSFCYSAYWLISLQPRLLLTRNKTYVYCSALFNFLLNWISYL